MLILNEFWQKFDKVEETEDLES